MVTGKVLVATEFCDFLCTRYNINPPDLLKKSYSCSKFFSIRHGLSYSHIGIVIVSQDEVRDEILYISG